MNDQKPFDRNAMMQVAASWRLGHPVKVDGKSRRRESVMRIYEERNSLLGLQK